MPRREVIVTVTKYNECGVNRAVVSCAKENLLRLSEPNRVRFHYESSLHLPIAISQKLPTGNQFNLGDELEPLPQNSATITFT